MLPYINRMSVVAAAALLRTMPRDDIYMDDPRDGEEVREEGGRERGMGLDGTVRQTRSTERTAR